MIHSIDDSLLDHNGRLDLARLLASQAAGYAFREESTKQDQLQKEVNARRLLTNLDVIAAAEQDSAPYVPAKPKGRGGRNVISLGDLPKPALVFPVIAEVNAQSKPELEQAPRSRWQRFWDSLRI